MFAAKNELLTPSPSGYKISRSLRFRSSASAYLSRSPSTTSSQTTWTWSGWVKRGKITDTVQHTLFGAQAATPAKDYVTKISFGGGDTLIVSARQGTDQFSITTSQVFRDPSAWYHIVVSIDTTQATSSNRVKIYVNGSLATVTGTYPTPSYSIQYINVASQSHFIGRYLDTSYEYLDGYLSEVNFIDGYPTVSGTTYNATTWAALNVATLFGETDPATGVWRPKQYTGTYGTNGFYLPFTNTANTQNLMLYSEQFDNAAWTKSGATITANSTTAPNGTTTADTLTENTANSGHYAVQSATITASTITTASVYAKTNGRYLELDLYSNAYANYVQCLFDLTNGTVSFLGSGSVTNSNYSITSVGNGWYRCVVTATLGSATTANLNCYLSNGSTANYTGNGTSGIYLWGAQLEQQSTAGPYYPTTSAAQTSINCLGADLSSSLIASSYNNWIPNNISLTSGTTYDSMIDTPTPYADGGNGRGNYCVLNPLDKSTSLSPSNGNLTWAWASASHQGVRATFSPTSGLYYIEVTVSSATTGSIAIGAGLVSSTYGLNSTYLGATSGSWGFYASNISYLYSNGVQLGSAGSSFNAGDILQIAWDVTNSKVWFGKNNVWYDSSYGTTGNPSTGANPVATSLPAGLFPYVECYAQTADINFGQRPFTYTPPSGYSALNTQNLPTPTIKKGNQYFDASLYQADGANSKTIINSGGFQPDFVWIKDRSAAQVHALWDVLRSNNYLSSSTTNAEAAMGQLTSLNSNGFTVGYGAGQVNYSTDSYVGWQWRGGGTGVSNTSGSITSTVSANTSAGFSVVTYTGTGVNATVGHGLGVAPSMVIVKGRNIATDWAVYHSAISPTYYLQLNTSVAQVSNTTFPQFGTTAPTQSVFNLGTASGTNNSGSTYVAYCFASVAGYSAFGSYTGNGSTDGPFIYTGFRPRWLMLKRTDSSTNWLMLDSSRNTYNVMGDRLLADTTAAETNDGPRIDFLSNGFKLRESALGFNASSSTQIYAAFAENPFKYSLAR